MVHINDYRQKVFDQIPSLEVLDGKNKNGEDVLEDESESEEEAPESDEEESLENEEDIVISEGEEEEEGVMPQKRGLPQQPKGKAPVQEEVSEEEEFDSEEEEVEVEVEEEGNVLILQEIIEEEPVQKKKK